LSSSGLLPFERSLTLATFLGGLSLGVLSFLFQVDAKILPDDKVPFFSNSEDYKGVLIFVTGIAGTLLIISVFSIKIAIVDNLNRHHPFGRIALLTYEAGLIALLALLPFLVYPFSILGTVIIIIIEVGWGIMFGVYKLRNWNVNREMLQSTIDELNVSRT
jgi:hypothetical protein